MSRIPELRAKIETEDAVADATEASELELLNGKIPKLLGILPDAFHDRTESGEEGSAALSHMLSRLLSCSDPDTPVRSFPTVTISNSVDARVPQTKIDIQPGLVDEGARLRHIHSSAYASFMRTIATIS